MVNVYCMKVVSFAGWKMTMRRYTTCNYNSLMCSNLDDCGAILWPYCPFIYLYIYIKKIVMMEQKKSSLSPSEMRQFHLNYRRPHPQRQRSFDHFQTILWSINDFL